MAMNQPLTLSDHLGGVLEAGREAKEGGKRPSSLV